MTFVILGLDYFDIDGGERLNKFYNLVKPNQIIINTNQQSLSRDLKYLKEANNLLDSELINSENDKLKFDLKKLIYTSCYVSHQTYSYFISNDKTSLFMTGIPTRLSFPKLPLKEDSKDLYKSFLSTQNVVTDLANRKKDMDYGTYHATLTLENLSPFTRSYTEEQIYKMADLAIKVHNPNLTTAFIGPHLEFIEYDRLAKKISSIETHKISLEDLSSYK